MSRPARPGLLAAACVAALLALTAAAPPASRAASARAASPVAATLFAKAEDLFAALKKSARAQRQRQSFTRVLDAYHVLFEKHPATRQAELSLLRAGELHTLLYRWTGQEGDLNRAQNYYERLVQTYPKSSLADDARLAIARLSLDQLKDPARAWVKFRELVDRHPDGDKAPEARAQLRRLARYAPPPAPPPPSEPLALSCPTPAAAQTVPGGAPASSSPALPVVLTRVRDIRHWSNPEYSRVVIHLDRKTNFYSNLLEDRSGAGKPPRIYVDLFNSLVEERLCRQITVNDGILLGVRAGQFTPDSVRVVLDIDRLRTYRIFPMQDPFRIVIDVTGGAPPPAPDDAIVAAAEAPPTAARSAAPVATVAPVAPARPAAPTLPSQPAASAATSRVFSLPPAVPIAAVPVPELAPLPPLPAPEAAPAVPQPTAATRPAARPPTAVATPPAPDRQPPPSPAPGAGAQPAGAPSAPPPAGPAVPLRSPAPLPAGGKLSLARQLGLGVRRIVIDAGHGAHDPGAPGIGGLQEKDVTLDVALRLREILQAGGYDTVLTRDRDVYLPLEERTAIANTARGDLFISVHCNASDAGDLRGVETYYLNLASSRRAMATAARENSMALANMSDLQHLVKEIYSSKMDESSRFADAVQRSLHGTLRRRHPDVRDLGVKQAPFYVLIGAQMPSVLAEISFINHKIEGKRLADPAYRQLVAQALADGVRRYVKTVKTATLAAPGAAAP